MSSRKGYTYRDDVKYEGWTVIPPRLVDGDGTRDMKFRKRLELIPDILFNKQTTLNVFASATPPLLSNIGPALQLLDKSRVWFDARPFLSDKRQCLLKSHAMISNQIRDYNRSAPRFTLSTFRLIACHLIKHLKCPYLKAMDEYIRSLTAMFFYEGAGSFQVSYNLFVYSILNRDAMVRVPFVL
jgi:hypothetical protein